MEEKGNLTLNSNLAENTLSKSESQDLIKTIKKYVNLFKALHLIDPAVSAEFKKKQEYFFNEKHKESNHKHQQSGGCCGGGKINYKIYIPKDKMNNIEKNLAELYESFYYQSNIEELLLYLNGKFENITKSGLKEGLTLDEESEKQLLHRLAIEGVAYFICEKLKKKLLEYEESISEQPMLLAHPSGVKNEDLINFINPQYVSDLIKNDYSVINQKVYKDINEYELYNQYKYLYSEGYFEDMSSKMEGIRSDFIFKHPYGYFNKSRHQTLSQFSNLIYYLPYELNKKFSYFSLQTNDYLQASYFRENHSEINFLVDSSFIEGKDTGKKLTVMFVLFPENLEISKRKLEVVLKYQNEDREINIELTSPLSCIIFKSRKFAYKIEKQSFPFICVFYYLHGPADKVENSC